MSAAVDIERLATILREAGKAEIMPRFRKLELGDIREKTSAIDLVTEADEAAERFIKAECEALAPGAVFIGEESVAADPALLDRLNEADLAIVVDPIDGTTNFAAGLPLFAVMAAVVSRGVTVGGIIYDPVDANWMIAEKGSGAFERGLDGTERRLAVAGDLPVAEMIGCASATFLPPEERRDLLTRLAAIRIVANYRNAGHEYRLLASGKVHFCYYSKLMPWDHLAGCLLVEEAGGYVARADGRPYDTKDLTGRLIPACGREAWEAIRATLAG